MKGYWKQLVRGRRNRTARRVRPRDLDLRLEYLEDRVTPVITAIFTPGAGLLTVLGDALDNTITVGRNTAGTIFVNNGQVPILGGTPTVANTAQLAVFGLGGNDNLSLDETNGALPEAALFGGAGNDTLVGGSGADQLFGQAGNDTLLGKGGVDLLFGGADNDVLTGGIGDDQVFGESGNDRMIWNPGDGTDLNEGGDGNDTVEVNGDNASEVFTATANGTRVRFDRTDPVPFTLDIGTSENLVVNANGGDDSITAGNGLAPRIAITMDGGAGNDTLIGGDGADLLLGGDGNDLIIGGRGNDVALIGAGDDTFVWNPGDGSDTVEGQAGSDMLLFNGANVSETIDIAANGQRVRFTRDIASVAMDLNGVEGINLNALGGADTITINDLSDTDVETVIVNLAGTPGGTTGDAQPDTVILNATDDADSVQAMDFDGEVDVIGLSSTVRIQAAEGANDQLFVNMLGGPDFFAAAALPAGLFRVTVDGGAGDDFIIGSQGDDVLRGGAGDDFVQGNEGNDLTQLGAGDDVYRWTSAAGVGSDTVEGQGGSDLLFFFGSGADENIDISANGGRVRLFRDVAAVSIDLDDVESIELRAYGGADNIVVGDLSGTDVTRVDLDLRGPAGGGDGQADTVIVNGTNAADQIKVAGSASGITVSGLAASVHIAGNEASSDRLTVNALAGDDRIDATALQANAIALSLNGGAGADVLIGSEGNDLVIGGTGNDVALMGAGDDTFIWNPGDGSDTVEGQAGSDMLMFNGANVSETIDIAANGQRVRFTRDIANIVMDLDGVEGINFNALGGADTITVNDLTGTDLTRLNLDLASPPGSGTGDGQADTVIVNGTNAADAIVVVGNASGTSVLGLAALVTINGAEATGDRLMVNALAGDDVVDASGLSADAIRLTADGGDGDDVLIGGAGDDTLLGGAGDDVLIGGPGLDILDGGPGDNILFQD